MKVFIGLALLSVAFATPVIQPITLPEAPLPAIEKGIESAQAESPAIKSIELPPPELPALEDNEELAAAMAIVDIKPAFIPEAVMNMLNDLGEIRADAVQIADNAEVPVETALDSEAPVDAVIVVDHAEEVVSHDAAVNVEPVQVVDIANAHVEAADVPVEADLDAEAPVDAVIVVEHAEEATSLDAVANVAPVQVVDIADVAVEAADVPVEAAVDAEVPVSAVIVVDHAEEAASLDAVENVDPVRVLDIVIPANAEIETSAVAENVDEAISPVRVADAPLEAQDAPLEAQDAPVVVDRVIVVDAPIVAAAQTEFVVNPIRLVDAPVLTDLEQFISNILKKHISADRQPNFVNIPAFPNRYNNPMWR